MALTRGAVPPRLPSLIAVLLVAETLVFSVTTVPGVRDDEQFHPLLDGWLQGAAYVTAAVLCALRPVTSRLQRLTWTLIAVALGLRALAFVVYLGFVREIDPLPYPSAADAGWLGMELVLIAALVTFASSHRVTLTRRIVLDGLVAGLTSAGILLVFLYDTLVDLTAPGTPSDALVTNLAYPIADVMLLAVMLGVLASHGWRPTPDLWLLTLGVVGFAIVDSVFLYLSTAGLFHPGTPISALSLTSTALIAAAAWVSGRPAMTRRPDALPGIVLPAVFALASIGLLIYASQKSVPLGGVILAASALVLAILRTAFSFNDIRSLAEARLQARTDDLTGLANRRAFNEAIGSALRDRSPGNPLALLIIDLDNFKDVNDTWGHHRGDELLALVAPRLEFALRGEDLLARVGGDEFAVVLDGADAATAGEVAERLRVAMRRPFVLVGRELHVEASVGIAVFPRDGLDAPELLRHADAAMYAAKASPSGFSFFHPQKHVSDRRRQETVEQLRDAIDSGQLVLHYQPQIALDGGGIVGVEALVRWQRPGAELLLPDAFLPQAESGGLMRALTAKVLEQAIEQCARWRAAGITVPVGVNLSVTNLLDLEFPDQVARLLERHGVPGDGIVLELTEELFMADPERGKKVIAGLKRTGVSIWVDDYGTGYSSLGYLRDLHDISGLKLDRSFVANLDADPRAEAIVESTVALTTSLGLDLVAEGVETAAVRDCLAALGCRQAQGFLFSPGVPAEQLALAAVDADLAQPG